MIPTNPLLAWWRSLWLALLDDISPRYETPYEVWKRWPVGDKF